MVKRRMLSLGEDEIDEILVRLPIKSIIKFESVCKGWLSKFRSRPFIEMHTRHQHSLMIESKKRGIKSKKRRKITSLPVNIMSLRKLREMAPRLSVRSQISVIGPLSNGIYCLISIPRARRDARGRGHLRIALFNPGIRQFRFFPPFPTEFRTQLDCILSSEFSLVSGFAALPGGSGLDYRVVVIIQNDKCLVVFVFSTVQGEWERLFHLQVFEEIGRLPLQCIEVCPLRLLKGCWHWITTTREDHSKFNVLSFNFALQSLSIIRGPPKTNDLPDLPHFRSKTSVEVEADVVVLQDHLSVIFSSVADYSGIKGTNLLEFDVWMMMDYGVEESWSRIFKIHPNCVASERPLLYWIEHEGEESNGIRIKRLWFKTIPEHVLSFDRKARGVVATTTTFLPPSEYISLNTGGISTYRESLERL